jgi:hypothetical protein
MVRKGLLRCWNCGAFMSKDIAAKYQQMQANPAPMVFSPLPEGEAVSFEPAEEDDFQLGTGGTQTDLSGLATAAGSAPSSAPDAGPDARRRSEEGPATPHSVATGGDALFEVAMQQEKESRVRRRRRPAMTGGARTPGGFIIFCPYGCRIEVKDAHRGMQGKCPKCRAPFIVPLDPPDYESGKKKAAETGAAAAAAATGGYRTWLDDLHVHVLPKTLTLKADSLAKDFSEADFGFGPEGLLLAKLAKKAGSMFGGGGGDKKKPELRAAVREHLQAGKAMSELPAGEKQVFTREQLAQLRVVQPAASRGDPPFYGTPVFGAGRIALQLPMSEGDAPPSYVSMGVVQFRKFVQGLQEAFGIAGLGANCGIPMTDEFDVAKCHYLSTPIKALKNLDFYKADPSVELVLAGWKCAACGLTISEDARQKEKLGGKGGKGLAKVKCPKCQQKFGEQPMYTIKDLAAAPSMSGDDEAAKEEPAKEEAAAT